MTDPRGSRPQRDARGRQAPWMAAESRTGEVRCPLCGSQNSAAAPFCRWCGTPLGRATDPVLGTTSRRALERDGGSMLGSILGALALLALVGVVGWLALTGNLGFAFGGADPSPTRRTGAATAAPSGSPSGLASAPASARPSLPPRPSITPPPTIAPITPTPAPSAAATLPPADTGLTCEPATIADASFSSWRIDRLSWSPARGRDTLRLEMVLRDTDVPQGAQVSVESVPLDQVESRFGVEPPTDGERALVLTFQGPVTIERPFDADPDLPIIRNVQVSRADGTTIAVVGVDGDGCHRLQAPDWASGSTFDAIDLELLVRRS